METGRIEVAALSGPFDLQATLESGQTYRWDRTDGDAYRQSGVHGGDGWYHTVLPATVTPANEPEVVRVRQANGALQWEASYDAADTLHRLLGLEDDLEAIASATPDEPLLQRAYAAFQGLRIVRDPPFPCLVSFICSAQMHVRRIHDIQRRLERTLGTAVEFDGTTYHAFPSPSALAAAGEERLRELGLGYRAPYVAETAAMVATGDAHPTDVRGRKYEAAREALTTFVGVGEKVADCVLLFALEFHEAVPLDTWIRGAIADHFPGCDRGSYRETSRAIRTRFGGRYAGYTQTYVFHYLRSRG